MNKFKDNYNNRPKRTKKFYSKDSITEKHGYITFDKQVKNMMFAGVNLAEYRRMANYQSEDVDTEMEVSRLMTDRGMDLVEAQEVLDRAMRNARKQPKEGSPAPREAVPKVIDQKEDEVSQLPKKEVQDNSVV